jgi:hypothetical protein
VPDARDEGNRVVSDSILGDTYESSGQDDYYSTGQIPYQIHQVTPS